MKLSKKAIAMLEMLLKHEDLWHGGVVIYGRGPTETIMSLRDKGLVNYNQSVAVLSMDKIVFKPRWFLTETGRFQIQRILVNETT